MWAITPDEKVGMFKSGEFSGPIHQEDKNANDQHGGQKIYEKCRERRNKNGRKSSC